MQQLLQAGRARESCQKCVEYELLILCRGKSLHCFMPRVSARRACRLLKHFLSSCEKKFGIKLIEIVENKLMFLANLCPATKMVTREGKNKKEQREGGSARSFEERKCCWLNSSTWHCMNDWFADVDEMQKGLQCREWKERGGKRMEVIAGRSYGQMTGSKCLIPQQETGIKQLAEQCLMSPTRAKPTNPLPGMKEKVSASDLWACPLWLEPSNDLLMGSPMSCQILKAARLRIITSKIFKMSKQNTSRKKSRHGKIQAKLQSQHWPSSMGVSLSLHFACSLFSLSLSLTLLPTLSALLPLAILSAY